MIDGAYLFPGLFSYINGITPTESAAGVTPVDYSYPELSLLRYGTNTTPGTTDMTAALANAVKVAQVAGGIVQLPAAVIAVTTIPVTVAANVSVTLQGQGKKSTYINQLSAAGTVFALTGASTPVDAYWDFRDFTITPFNATVSGIVATGLARCNTWNLGINGGLVGFDAVGTLISNHFQPSWNNSTIGYRSRVSGAVRCNLVQFFGGEIRGCPTRGMDIGDTNGLHIYGLDNESNGSAANTATGGMIIRSTCGTETGNSNISINGGWFEGNLGRNIDVEAATGLLLSLNNVPLINSESGRALTVAAIGSIQLNNVVAAGASDTVTLAASQSGITNSTFHTLTDTSTVRVYVNVTTSTSTIDTGSSIQGSTFVLVAGTKTVSDSRVRAASKIILTSQADGGTPGWLRVTTVGSGTFSVTSSSGTDTSTVAYQILNAV